MPKGHRPKTSQDPQEHRMITWRMKGALHARLVKAANSIGLSLNSFITRAVRDSIDDVEERNERRSK